MYQSYSPLIQIPLAEIPKINNSSPRRVENKKKKKKLKDLMFLPYKLLLITIIFFLPFVCTHIHISLSFHSSTFYLLETKLHNLL